MPVNLIEVRDLTVRYGSIQALSGISFDAEEGDYIGIVGPNGSGKTSLIKSMLGLLPFEGTISFQGNSFSQFTRAKHVGYLPQKMAFLDQRFPATVREIVVSGVYCCKNFPKRLRAEDYTAAEKAMEILEISDLRDRSIGRLSGGQQQRVLLARAIVHNPQILVLDEPTVALDPQSREIFHQLVEKLNREKQVTIFMVSHDAAFIGRHISKILYLDRQMVFYGSFEDFCKSPKVSDYFGPGQHGIFHKH